MLDNDMEVSRFWLEELVLRVEESNDIMAACSKVVFPNCTVQFNGAFINEIDKDFLAFNLYQNGYGMLEPETTDRIECDWVPGGATIYRKAVFTKAQIDNEYKNVYEDNDFSMQLRRLNYKMVNCPLSISIHHHIDFDVAKQEKEFEYFNNRNNHEKFLKSYKLFYKKWKKMIYDDHAFKLLGTSMGPDISKIIKKSMNE
jgi:GT2 family glycosyltransferase